LTAIFLFYIISFLDLEDFDNQKTEKEQNIEKAEIGISAHPTPPLHSKHEDEPDIPEIDADISIFK